MSWTKDVEATLDYSFDWTEWLQSRDIITSATFSVSSGDGALTILGSEYTRKIATVLLVGGTVGQEYTITCRITTRNSLVEEESTTLVVE
tara:strand:- start:45605 stop:45874 length:270 start_codon:yes stop_codon:yes gene_type:complete